MGGVFLLAAAEERPGPIETLTRLIPDQRDPARITHTMAETVRARVFAIACGYPDADDLRIPVIVNGQSVRS
jgi:Transposase DDE domain group 1